MARAKKTIKKEPVDKVETPKVTATVAHVMQNGTVVRTYTKERHGDDFMKHAETYVTTRDDSYSVATE